MSHGPQRSCYDDRTHRKSDEEPWEQKMVERPGGHWGELKISTVSPASIAHCSGSPELRVLFQNELLVKTLYF